MAVLQLGGLGMGLSKFFFTMKNQRIAIFFTLNLDIGDCCVDGYEPYGSINDGMFRPVHRLVAPP